MSSLSYRPDIDGLRALAVISVLIYHLNNNWLPGGFVGVDIFFVISGFLITGIIVKEKHAGTFSFTNFYTRRIRRIFPALFVMLFFSGLAAYLSLPKEEFSSFFGDFKYAAAQIANIHFSREIEYMGVGVESSPLLHTWSLGVEEQFYLVWPAIILFLFFKLRPHTGQILIGVLFLTSLILCEYFLHTSQSKQAFYMFYSRAYELIIGAALALGITAHIKSQKLKEFLSFIGLVLIMASLAFLQEGQNFPGWRGAIPSLGAAFIIAGGSQSKVNQVLSFKPIVFIGLISYSLYLWHWPLISFTTNFTRAELTFSQTGVIAVLSFILAYLSWRYVEKPFRKPAAKKLWTWSPRTSTIATAMLLILVYIVLGNVIRTNDKHLGRNFDDPLLAQAFTKERFAHMNCVNSKQPEEDTDPTELLNCIFKNKENPDVILLGDSHALYQRFVIEEWAKRQGLTFTSLAIPACSAYIGDYAFLSPDTKKSACSRVNKEVRSWMNTGKLSPQYIFIVNRYDTQLVPEPYSEFFVQGQMDKPRSQRLTHLIDQTAASFAEFPNLQTVFFGQPPVLNGGPSVCLEKHQSIPLFKWFIEPEPCPTMIEGDLHRTALIQHHKNMQNITSAYPNVHFFDVMPYFTSLYDQENRITYHDDDHISRFGSLQLLKPFSTFMSTSSKITESLTKNPSRTIR